MTGWSYNNPMATESDTANALTPDAIARAAARLAPHVVHTPVVELDGARLGLDGMQLALKLEHLQTAGAFKFRGATNHMLGEAGRRGAVTVSSGNHGIALAEAGRRHGARVVVVLSRHANLWKRERMAERGAELHVAPDNVAAFAMARDFAERAGLVFVHPYDGLPTLEGTASLGHEFAAQAGPLDAVVVAVGGGGLAAGVAAALHAADPDTEIFGVEPVGAPTLTRALAAGAPVTIEAPATIADSLAAPIAAPMSLALCRDHLANVVTVSDEAIVAAMRRLYLALRQAVEPSAAVGLAALDGPLRARLAGRRVGLILCGANQDPAAQLAMLATKEIIS